ncbi:sulfotransferase family protein [Skermanella sp. TT6]|nr:sulfotransferase [Skermanella sp. TT6]
MTTRRRSLMEHPLCGADLRTLSTVLARNGPVPVAYLPQAVAAFGSALGRLPFTAAERAWTAWRLRREPDLPPPLFILGHWRSGTTHLYNVMSRSPRFGFVPPLAVGLPWDVLTLGRLLRPWLEQALPESRYIDNVAVNPDSPQEDEIGLANMIPLSFYHGIYFPSRFDENHAAGVFLDGCGEEDIRRWRDAFVYFLRKVALQQGRDRLLVKNPVHTARVDLLRAIWPDAKFIHIHRDPHEVFVSTVGFYRKLLAQFALQPYDHVDVERVVLETYPRMMSALIEQTRDLPSDRFVEVAFDRFERDPLGEVARIYRTLDLPGFEEARPRFEAYLRTVKGYSKNSYRQDEAVRQRVRQAWAPYVERFGREAAESAG